MKRTKYTYKKETTDWPMFVAFLDELNLFKSHFSSLTDSLADPLTISLITLLEGFVWTSEHML